MRKLFLLCCRHAKQKAQQGEVAEAAAVLSQYGAAADPAHFDLYKHVVGGVLALPRSDQSKQGERDCKDFLWQLVQPAVGAGGSQLPVQVGYDKFTPFADKVSPVVTVQKCSAKTWLGPAHSDLHHEQEVTTVNGVTVIVTTVTEIIARVIIVMYTLQELLLYLQCQCRRCCCCCCCCGRTVT